MRQFPHIQSQFSSVFNNVYVHDTHTGAWPVTLDFMTCVLLLQSKRDTLLNSDFTLYCYTYMTFYPIGEKCGISVEYLISFEIKSAKLQLIVVKIHKHSSAIAAIHFTFNLDSNLDSIYLHDKTYKTLKANKPILSSLSRRLNTVLINPLFNDFPPA